MDESRKHDIVEVEKGLKSSNPTMRDQAKKAGDKIKSQQHDGWLRQARLKLIEESKKGNKGNAWEIRDEIVKHRKLGIGKTSFSLDISGERYREIFGHN